MQLISKGWLTIEQASQHSGYNKEYIRQLVRGGRVAFQRASRVIYVNVRSLQQYKKSTRGQSARQDGSIGPVAASNRAGWLDPRLTADRYLSDSVVRGARNEQIAAFLDNLANVSPAEATEQKRTGRMVEQALKTRRLNLRQP